MSNFPEMEYKSMEPEEPRLPKDIRALEVLQMAYRGELKLSPQQMRAAMQRFPSKPRSSQRWPSPRCRKEFAVQLEKAIARSTGAKLIEGKPCRSRNSTAIRSVTGPELIVSPTLTI